jgi:hypothetical protein
MKTRRLTLLTIAGVLGSLFIVVRLMASGPPSPFFNGFETDTSGWFDDTNAPPDSGLMTRQPSGYTNGGGYGDGVASAAGGFHARLSSTDCHPSPGTCYGPYTDWGTGFSSDVFPPGGFFTQVDIYLDVLWAGTHQDVRFDWDTAIQSTTNSFLSDYVFNAGTTPSGPPGFVIGSSPNAFRSNTFPSNPCPNPSAPPNYCRTPVVITTSGWYTFRHTFRDDGSGNLAVDLTILDSGANVVANWTIYQGFALSGVGGPAYGWFANEEISDLPIDNSALGLNTPPCSACLPPPPPPPANTVTVTSCTTDPNITTTSAWTQINVPTKDVVLRCGLNQRPGTTGVRIIAHSIKVDGSNGFSGAISSSGTAGIQLIAGSGSGNCNASATVDLESATVSDSNPNGGVKVTACGDVVMNSSPVTSSAGATVSVTSSDGNVCAFADSLSGRAVSVTANGDLTVHGSTITTASPSDTIKLVSNNGSVLAGGAPCPPNKFLGGVDSNMTVTAKALVDLTNACVQIGENITITASGTGFTCGSDVIINLANSEIRNDFGRTGVIKASACSNSGKIDITDAVLVDTGAKGGGVDPNAVASLNGGKVTTTICGAISPNPPNPDCNSQPISLTDNPVCADEADRTTNHHVAGTPKVDR